MNLYEEIGFVICPSNTKKSKLIKEKKGVVARKPNQINQVLFSQVIYGKTISDCKLFFFLCFVLYLGLIVSGPRISPYKGSLGFILVWSQYK